METRGGGTTVLSQEPSKRSETRGPAVQVTQAAAAAEEIRRHALVFLL